MNKDNWKNIIESENKLEALHAIINFYLKKQRSNGKKESEEKFNKVVNTRAKEISLKELKYFSGEKNINKQYDTIEIPKKRGGFRKISIPKKRLKLLQRALLEFLAKNFKPHKTAFGFVEKKSIVDNAKLHVGKKYVVCFDIKDFFPSINWGRIFGMLQNYPFNADKETARIITNLVTYYDGELNEKVLPQGAPTSPYLANMICRKLDSRIYQWAMKRKGITYSRYADDITLSTNDKSLVKEILNTVPDIIKDEGFKVNEEKTRVLPYYKRQIVTGLVVNKKVNLPREYIRNLRALLHNIEKFGWESQISRDLLEFNDDDYLKYLNYGKLDNVEEMKVLSHKKFENYIKTQKEEHKIIHRKNHINFDVYNNNIDRIKLFKLIVKGKINFLKMVRGKEDAKYKDFLDSYHLIKLMKNDSDTQIISLIKKLRKESKKENCEEVLKKFKNYLIKFNKINKENSEYSNTLLEGLEEEFNNYKNRNSKCLHNPKELSEVLSLFSKKPLKYSTHDWGEGEDYINNNDYNKFIKNIKKEWEKHFVGNVFIRQEFFAKIKSFLFEEFRSWDKSWDTYQLKEGNKINFGWSEKEFKKWVLKEKSEKPKDYLLPQEINGFDETISSFGDVIRIFKNEIEFRKGTLYKIFKKIKDKYKNILEIDIENSDEFKRAYTVYTNVYGFYIGVEKIFDEIKKSSTNNKSVKISLEAPDNNDKLIIKILHKNSYPNKSYDNEKFDCNSGDLSSIKEILTNICDWAIATKFNQVYKKINCLSLEKNERVEELNEKINGFLHLLTFYRRKSK